MTKLGRSPRVRRVPVRVCGRGRRGGVAGPGKIAWSKCYRAARAVRVRHRAGAARLRQPERHDDLARGRSPAGDRSGAPDRLAVPEPGRPRRLGRRLHGLRRAVPLHATRCARGSTSSASTRAGSNRSTALRCFGTDKQWGPYFTPFAFPSTPEEEQIWIERRLLPRFELRTARRPDRRPHVDGQRRARPRRAAPGRRRRQAQLRRRLVRDVARVRRTRTCSRTTSAR